MDVRAAILAHNKRTRRSGGRKGHRSRNTNTATGPVNRWHNYIKTKEVTTSCREVKKQQKTGGLSKARPQLVCAEPGQSPGLLPVEMEIDETRYVH